jgi:Zn-dependent protease with chaperone function
VKRLNPNWIRLILVIIFITSNVYSLSNTNGIRYSALSILVVLLLILTSYSIKAFLKLIREGFRILRKVNWQPITEDFQPLIERFGVKLNKQRPIGILSDWINAAAIPGKQIVFGQPLFDNLDKISLQGIAAHELAHIKKSHLEKMFIILILITFPFALYQTVMVSISDFMAFIMCVSFLLVVYSLLSWHFEYQADSVAAHYVGPETVIAGLRNICTLAKKDGSKDSFTHPSIVKRITRLQKNSCPSKQE